MNSLSRFTIFLAIALFAYEARASEAETGIVFLRVELIQLNNKLDPTGYEEPIFQFKVKNIDTGKKYTGSASSEAHPSMLHVPPGTYCLYSMNAYTNQELTYCGSPLFEVKADRMISIGDRQFGISYESNVLKLIHSFENQEEVSRLAMKRYPRLFSANQSDAR